MGGMEVLAKAWRGRAPALVLGVQGANVEAALEYLERAEDLGPDALIAIPPTEARSADDFRRYYEALGASTKRPLFIQTTGGAKGITPPVEMITGLAKQFPNLGYVKEEAEPVTERMLALAKERPVVRSLFSGAAGKGLLYELRLGMDGTLPRAPIARGYLRILDRRQTHDRVQGRA